MKTVTGIYTSAIIYHTNNPKTSIEPYALAQIQMLCDNPAFEGSKIRIMPDVHPGKAGTIGFTATVGKQILPQTVGIDIGCGITMARLSGKVRTDHFPKLDSLIREQIPSGSQIRRTLHRYADHFHPEAFCCKNSINEVKAVLSLGSLGGGNHFIEIQEDENGMACIMLHSGSRMFGNMIGQYFNKIAHEMNDKYFSTVPSEYNLPFLPVDTDEGQRYLNWMKLAMDFAFENREVMLEKVKHIFTEQVEKYTGITPNYSDEINCHHNYAALENHYGENVWVHRKGAIHAAEGEVAIIPGSMGSNSYIVRGMGKAESFLTSSHGAGRNYSRTGAKEKFSVESVMVDLRQRNVVLGKTSKKDVAEECRFAYKDIDVVMKNQSDLTTPIKKLFTVGVVKG